jgi:hypothetical protein
MKKAAKNKIKSRWQRLAPLAAILALLSNPGIPWRD